MKKHSKVICLIGIIFLLGMLFLMWKQPQKTSDLQGKNQCPEEMFTRIEEWKTPKMAVCVDAPFQKTPGTFIFGQFRMAEQAVKDGGISRYQLFYIIALWYIGLLLPQLTVRGLRKKFTAKNTALWHNIYYIHRGDGKKKLSVATG